MKAISKEQFALHVSKKGHMAYCHRMKHVGL